MTLYSDEIPSVTRPWSASTVNTVVSEMTIPSPAQTPREEAEPKVTKVYDI